MQNAWEPSSERCKNGLINKNILHHNWSFQWITYLTTKKWYKKSSSTTSVKLKTIEAISVTSEYARWQLKLLLLWLLRRPKTAELHGALHIIWYIMSSTCMSRRMRVPTRWCHGKKADGLYSQNSKWTRKQHVLRQNTNMWIDQIKSTLKFKFRIVLWLWNNNYLQVISNVKLPEFNLNVIG